MSTAPLSHPRGPVAAGLRAPARVSPRSPALLAVALLLLVLYAAFSHGAAAVPTGARIQVAIAALAAIAGAAWLWSGTLRFAAPRTALAGVALLTAFAAWSGVTILWSVAPDQTWNELNRALTYVIVLCLAVALGASHRHAPELIAKGFLSISLAVTAYALGQKLLPGLHVAGLFDLNQTGPLPRLQEPLGYWNALALFIALGVPTALGLAVDSSGSRRMRLGGVTATSLMMVAIAFTYSRGGLIALAVAAGVAIALSGARLRSLMWLAVACLAAIPSLVFGLSVHALTTANVSLGSRERAGVVLLAVLLISLIGLILGTRKLCRLEASSQVGPELARRIARLLVGLFGAASIALLLAITLSSRGLTGTISHAWSSFTTTRATSNYDPARLLSADSENRWVWWNEAAGAFTDRPLGGWGAGSFGVVHLLYRRNTLSVSQPHSVPLQFLAETGIVGTLLALGGLALLLVAGVNATRRRARGPDRVMLAALLGGAAAYAVHALYDWDWNIPAVSMSALVFLGVLAGAGASAGVPRVAGQFGPGVRALALGVLTLCTCIFALSGVLPSLAASKADSALVGAASSSPAALDNALASAVLASQLDPLSDAGLRVQATIAMQQGQPQLARSYLRQAVRRDPSDGTAWGQLAFLELSAGNVRDGALAATRVLELDPQRQGAASFARTIAEEVDLFATPPKASATAQPLSPG